MSVTNVSSSTVSSAPISKPKKAEDAEKTTKTSAPLAAQAYAKTTSVKPTVSDAANVQISQKAREMSLARKTLDETPDVREDKVSFFKEKIAKGEYKPQADKILDGITREAIKEELAKTPDVALE